MEGQSGGRVVYPVVAAQYKLLEEIGYGLGSTVHRAICLLYNEVVAIKTMDLESSNAKLDDIRRETVAMRLTNHPNLVKVHCSFVVDQSVWVVMPYMAGGSCLHIMKAAFQDGFEEPVIATILRESLKALEYLHRQGHIHRDVKAGNILLDGDGSVKLGDFGVSASLYDSGDRQRARTTFVGTPCWMAPEVIEKLNGYDFKADIWSFGITALELAHGHAPFSKYPPMKVLLMTLQNAPPGLDYERDKKFSKAFKEMIAMCLVKEPTRRPSAERLLRHSFFKHARSSDYIYRHVLDGLPPLAERLKNLKILDASRLAEKKMPFEEQEQKSQSEYKRGVSAWNFNIEDLKAQAALISDEDDHADSGKEEDDPSKQHALKGQEDVSDIPSHIPPPFNINDGSVSQDTGQPPVTLHIVKVEAGTDAGDQRVTRVRSGTLPSPVQQPTKPTNGQKPGPPSAKREPKHIGRFDVFEDDADADGPGNQGVSRPEDPARRDREPDQRELRKPFNDREHREHRRHEDRDRDEPRKSVTNSLTAERNRAREDDRERDKELRQGGRSAEEILRHRDRAFSGPLATSERVVFDQRPVNGVNQGASRPSSGSKEAGIEEKAKGSAQKAPVVQRGRFSVTSDDVDLEDPPHGNTRRSPSSQALQQQQALPSVSSLSNLNSAGSVPVVALLPHLQNALNHAVMQQDALLHVLNSINPNEASTQPRVHATLKHSRSSNSYIGGDHSMPEVSNDRERELLQQIAELQSKIALLVDELQAMKLRNVLLERQLNAHYNREEEERIRKEEAANDDG